MVFLIFKRVSANFPFPGVPKKMLGRIFSFDSEQMWARILHVANDDDDLLTSCSTCEQQANYYYQMGSTGLLIHSHGTPN